MSKLYGGGGRGGEDGERRGREGGGGCRVARSLISDVSVLKCCCQQALWGEGQRSRSLQTCVLCTNALQVVHIRCLHTVIIRILHKRKKIIRL